MLDLRLYRAAFVLVLIAVLATAFSLETRPRPLRSTLAPDAFDGTKAGQTVDALAASFPVRRAGDAADERLARRIASELRALGPYEVRTDRFRGDTAEGEGTLVNVVATRVGAPGPGIVVVAHRDAARPGSKAELSGTAALLELARVAGDGRLRRTITFISTTGGSSGAAGAVRAARRLGERANAVLVLGDMGSVRVRRPFVVGFSNGRGAAPLRLRRTVEAAIREEIGRDAGGSRAATQWARLAAPATVGEQGAFGREGQPAVLLSATGERGPAPDAAISDGRLQTFGRAALRVLYGLDTGRDLAEAPSAEIVVRNRVLPLWAVRLLTATLLLPPLLVAIDALARVRRRREPVAPWVLWTVSCAVPFVAALLFLKLLALVGLLGGVPPAPIPAAALEVGGSAIVALVAAVLAFVLGWLARPALLRAVDGPPAGAGVTPAAGVAALLVLSFASWAIWAANPYAAMLLVPAVHLWLLALVLGGGVRRALAVLLVPLALVLPALVFVADARAFGFGAAEAAWSWALLVAGGHLPWWTWTLWSVVLGTGVATTLVALRTPRPDDDLPTTVTVRGPLTYAGPGSLGGTDSALRR